jgi:hypothetical protein
VGHRGLDANNVIFAVAVLFDKRLDPAQDVVRLSDGITQKLNLPFSIRGTIPGD